MIKAFSLTDLEINSTTAYSSEFLRNVTSIREQIMDHLFQNYQKHERPGEVEKETTKVTVYMTITAITSVDVRMMEYTTDLLLRQEWKDQRLSWAGIAKFRNYTNNLVTPELKRKLWLPDLFFRNGKEGRLHKMTCPNYLTRIEPSGMILYSQKLTMRFSCQMDLKTFPMDSQECHINIGSYGYELNELHFVWRNDTPVFLAPGMQISEFNSPEQVTVEDCNDGPLAMTDRTSCLDATFILSRQLGSWFSSIYIPNFLIVAASWHSFWVDIDAQPARVALGLLTLLGLITQASGVSSTLPRVSYIKAIDVWNIVCIIFNVGVLIEFAVASNLARQQKVLDWKAQARQTVRREIATWCLACRRVYVRNSLLNDSRDSKKRSGGPGGRSSLNREGDLLHTLFPEQIKMAKSLCAPEQYARDEFLIISAADRFCRSLLLDEEEEEEEEEDFVGEQWLERKTVQKSEDQKEPVILISAIDGYSRFLFPSCFMLYNCFYWLYYLVLKTKD
ncbi:unnamed protein product [Schistocephalus solidus]|uniref:Glycine receptor subunit alphaZ1 n=1 Tax=Schistocephalus solidus TaxID=70667 RepID=A0A183SR08_SCHSO|nr:unnamed protein product [Schistocephalus solidus]